jgi:hypothetical protein
MSTFADDLENLAERLHISLEELNPVLIKKNGLVVVGENRNLSISIITAINNAMKNNYLLIPNKLLTEKGKRIRQSQIFNEQLKQLHEEIHRNYDTLALKIDDLYNTLGLCVVSLAIAILFVLITVFIRI